MWTKKNFKCDRYCGKCCKELVVRVSKREINKIRKLGYEDFVEVDYVDPSKFVLKKNKKGCVFLKKNKKGRYSCGIHKNRPKICQKYPFFDTKPIKSCYPEDLYPSAFFSFKEGRLSEGDLSSMRKSGQRGRKRSFCSSVSLSKRTCVIQAASGDRIALLDRRNPVDESKKMPVPSCSVHRPSWRVILALRFPVFPPVGGITNTSPCAFRSSLRSRLC